MINYVLLVFAIGALGGLVLAAHVLRGKFAPWALSLLHALLGAIGLVMLILMLAQGDTPQRVVIGFVLLLIAALGGFFLEGAVDDECLLGLGQERVDRPRRREPRDRQSALPEPLIEE